MKAQEQHDLVKAILADYPIPLEETSAEPFGSGLINTTYRIRNGKQDYILQKINEEVFRDPGKIAENIRKIDDFLQHKHPEYFFVSPLQTKDSQTMAYREGNGYYRLVPFVDGSLSLDVVNHPEEAFESAAQFGRFTAKLHEFHPGALKITLPDFHNLTLRYEQFQHILKNGNQQRIREASKTIQFIESHQHIVAGYESICQDPAFPIRVMHHDTKISNVLLDRNLKGICVIDLDTVMPGHFFSDVGDMLRTYLSPVSEEELNLDKNIIRIPIFEAIIKGYFQEMKDVLTHAEKKAFLFAGKIMIYMQAIRFLSDHFNDDIYYGAKYPGHNYFRALNQIDLLQKFIEKEPELQTILDKQINTTT